MGVKRNFKFKNDFFLFNEFITQTMMDYQYRRVAKVFGKILALVLSFGCGVTFTKLDDRWKIFVFSCLGIWICAYIMLKILLACHPEPGKTTIISQKEIFGKISYGSNRFFRNKKILI